MEKKMLKKILGLFLTISIVTPSAFARDQINIVGSSTVYPFAIVVAEKFGKTTDYKTPKIETTGSGGGLKLFVPVLVLGILILQTHQEQLKKVK